MWTSRNGVELAASSECTNTATRHPVPFCPGAVLSRRSVGPQPGMLITACNVLSSVSFVSMTMAMSGVNRARECRKSPSLEASPKVFVRQSRRELVEASGWESGLILAQNLPSTSDSDHCGHQVFCWIQQCPSQAVMCQ